MFLYQSKRGDMRKKNWSHIQRKKLEVISKNIAIYMWKDLSR